MSEQEIQRLRSRYERERAARKEAERLAEERTRDLWLANQQLTQITDHLEHLVTLRTGELQQEIAVREAAVEARTQMHLATQRTLARTEALYKVSRSLIEVATIDELLQSFVDNVAEAINADPVLLFGIDLNEEKINYGAHNTRSQFEHRDWSFAELMSGLTGWVLRNGQTAVSKKDVIDPRETDDVRRVRSDAQVGSLVVAPLRHRNRVLGTVTAVRRLDQPDFGDDDVDLLNAMASQASVAIANAQLLEEMRQARAEAESANQAKSRFLANMSHELRTPLNGILGYAQILQRDSNLSPTTHNGLSIIERSGHHLLTLINDILDLSKIEAERMELAPTEFHLGEFLEVITGIIRVRAEQKGINFVYDQRSPLPAVVEFDEQRLRQVLLNILGNAVKFTQAGQVVLSTGYHHERIRFQISDSGVGIAVEELEKIFEPFRQSTSRPAWTEGTGLGLAISDRLVQMMGGKIHVRSELGRGSTFFFDLHLPERSSAHKPLSAPTAKIVGYAGPRRTVLVVDDRDFNRTILRDLLEPMDFAVLLADDGNSAVTMTLEHRPDLVLMDLVMPGMGGFAAAKAIRSELGHAAPPIIAISASVFDVTKEQCQAEGCIDFIPKPVDINLLLQIMSEHMVLNWVYAESTTVVESEKPVTATVQLPHSVLAAMHESVLIGDVLALQAQVASLAAELPHAQAFLGPVRTMVDEFQLEELQDWLELHLKEVAE